MDTKFQIFNLSKRNIINKMRGEDMLRNIDWEMAINQRRSTRSFQMKPVEEDKINLIKSFIKKIEVPFEHSVKIRMFKANPNKKLYTVFSSPPDNAAFITNTDICSISKAGFIGELLILYATSLGLSTCWYGHYSLAELEGVMPHLGDYFKLPNPKWGYGKGVVEGERAICITPLGYWMEKGFRLVDRIQTSFFSHKRKPISDLIENDIQVESLPTEILYALELARKAPSGANSQHWRFNISPDYKRISIAKPIGYKHIKWEHPDVDIGICASHFWLGLKMKNIATRVSLREDKDRAIWSFDLM